ncbi:MAG TPA: CPBP family intramembrane glutamic endopeptidase [Anaerolineales bacterium]|nr:CPBP family intramembrane glutamic endopeptidase [Anaerolineales bacterium]
MNFKNLALITIVFQIFCGLSWLGQIANPLLGLAILMGIAFPLIWGQKTGKWAEMGFTRQNIRMVLLWSVIAGVISSMVGLIVLPELSIADKLGIQLAIGIPVWALVASPFQEFFFRGWLQTRFEKSLGGWWGLIIANTCFTLWHYVAPFVGKTMVPLDTFAGVVSTFAAGLVYSFSFYKTKSIITPWLAHTLTGITFIIVGAMDFTQPIW